MPIDKVSIRLAAYDTDLRDRYGKIICGVDESGRGAWAGVIAAGACILPPGVNLPGLNDSKAMTSVKRKELAIAIKAVALIWRVEYVNAEEIDKKGLTWANQTVMHRAAQWCADRLESQVNLYVVDQAPVFALRPHLMMSRADSTSLSVAAAAVLAKTERDASMRELALRHPEYDWGTRHGYVSDYHVEAVRKYGMVDGVHRKSYKIKALAKEKQLTMDELI